MECNFIEEGIGQGKIVDGLFADIRITDLDTNKSHVLPSQNGTHRIYLTLSGAPPATWRDIFDRERRTVRTSTRCDTTFEGTFIIITCTPEDLEKYHFEFLKEDVQAANEKYRLSITEQAERATRLRESQEEQKKLLKDVRDRLKFD